MRFLCFAAASILLSACSAESTGDEEEPIATENGSALTSAEQIDGHCKEPNYKALVLCHPDLTREAFRKMDSTFNGLRTVRVCLRDPLGVATKADLRTLAKTKDTKPGDTAGEDPQTWTASGKDEVTLKTEFLEGPGVKIMSTQKPEHTVWLTLDLDKRLENLPQDKVLFSPARLKKFFRAGNIESTNADLQATIKCTYFTK
jgi:hypothetical protein